LTDDPSSGRRRSTGLDWTARVDGRKGRIDAIRTVGHGTLDAASFAELVRYAGVEVVIDVRRFPGSRRHPHFASDEMSVWLPELGTEYRWLPALGGRRKMTPGSSNLGLRNSQFRAYGDHMSSREFDAGIGVLRSVAAERAVALMCSESLWWRCHRRLVADHLALVEGLSVEHLFHDGRLVLHPLTPEARRADGHVVYDVPRDT
jgi:uncharacterized protein (DUF488 family)